MLTGKKGGRFRKYRQLEATRWILVHCTKVKRLAKLALIVFTRLILNGCLGGEALSAGWAEML